jgi:hypothetical protein
MAMGKEGQAKSCMGVKVKVTVNLLENTMYWPMTATILMHDDRAWPSASSKR